MEILEQCLSGNFSFSPHVLFQRLVLYKNYNMSEEDHTLDELLFLPGTKMVMFQLINIPIHISIHNNQLLCYKPQVFFVYFSAQ